MEDHSFQVRPPVPSNLFEIRAHDSNKLIGSFAFRRCGARTQNVVADMAFDHFVHQTVDCSAGGGDDLQDFGALVFCCQGLLNRLNLATNTPYARQKGAFRFPCMCHTLDGYITYDTMAVLETLSPLIRLTGLALLNDKGLFAIKQRI